jgi:hypothetical protein
LSLRLAASSRAAWMISWAAFSVIMKHSDRWSFLDEKAPQ